MQTSRSLPEARRVQGLPGAALRALAPVNKTTKTATVEAQPRQEPSRDVFNAAVGEVRRVLIYVAAFSMVINLLMLIGPIYMLQVYDRVLSSGSLPTLAFLTLAAVGLTLASALLEGTRSRVLVRLGGRFDEMLSESVFSRILENGLSGKAMQERPLRDLDTVRNFLTGAGLFFFFDAPWTPLFLAFVLVLHPALFVVALTGAVILFGIAVASELVTRKPLTDSSRYQATASRFAGHVASNAETVEAMGMLPGLRQRWLQQYRAGLALQATASDRAGVLTAMTKFLRPGLQVAILGVGAYLVLAGQITGGAMVAASIIMGRALAPVEGAIGNWRSFVLARAAYARIKNVMQEPGRQQSRLPLPAPQGALAVERLVASPPGMLTPVIKGISFALEAGDSLGIIGPSASGKSTLARLIVGVWAPANGHVRLDGASVSDWNHLELGPHIGYLPQEVDLFDGSVAENIARFTDADPQDVVAAAQLADVHELILRLPNGYDTRIGLDGVVLSGGQRQRIGLARALFGNPTLVVLDEPNSNLDAQGEAALRRALESVKRRGATVIVIAHRPSILGEVEKLLVLRDGMIEQFGARDEVMNKIRRVVPKPAPDMNVRQQQAAVAGLRSA